jgi:hypothetical protein
MKHKAELTQQKLDIEFHLQMAWMGHHIQAQAGPSNAVHSSAATSSGYSDTGSAAPNDALDMGTEFNFSSEGFNFSMPDYQ